MLEEDVEQELDRLGNENIYSDPSTAVDSSSKNLHRRILERQRSNQFEEEVKSPGHIQKTLSTGSSFDRKKQLLRQFSRQKSINDEKDRIQREKDEKSKLIAEEKAETGNVR